MAVPHIAVVGSIIMDLAITTPRVPQRGENILAHGFHRGPGGKGANASVALARMGARARLVGRVGSDDFGWAELDALRQEGVEIDSVGIDPERHTGVAVIMVDDEGENTILVAIGANEGLTPEFVTQALAPHLDSLDGLLVNFEIPELAVRAAIETAYAKNIPVVVDAGPPRKQGAEVWRQATVISPNMLEAAYLVGYEVSDEATAHKAARDLLAQGPKAVVLKMGALGALLATAEGEELIEGYRVEVVDTTGAGDAFTSALTLGVAEGMPWLDAVRRANAAGALAVTKLGTMVAMPTRAEVERFMAERG